MKLKIAEDMTFFEFRFFSKISYFLFVIVFPNYLNSEKNSKMELLDGIFVITEDVLTFFTYSHSRAICFSETNNLDVEPSHVSKRLSIIGNKNRDIEGVVVFPVSQISMSLFFYMSVRSKIGKEDFYSYIR